MNQRTHRWDLSTDTVQQNFIAYVSQMRLSGKRPVVEFVKESRSLDQNAMSFALYKEIAAQIGDQTIKEVRAECKLVHGVPILRASSEKFRDTYDKVIKPHDYATKLEIMDYLPVTSLMNKEQFSEFIDTVIREYSKRGIAIVMPGEG